LDGIELGASGAIARRAFGNRILLEEWSRESLAMARSGGDLGSCPICSAAVAQDSGFTFAAILALAMASDANAVFFFKLMNGLGCVPFKFFSRRALGH
jgi:hypothetical protein